MSLYFVFYSSSHVLAKTVMTDEWERYSFLSKRGRDVNLRLVGPLGPEGPRGINKKEKKNIVKNLVPLMKTFPNSDMRARFWERLPASRDVVDLAEAESE